jgi:hypothetical protein
MLRLLLFVYGAQKGLSQEQASHNRFLGAASKANQAGHTAPQPSARPRFDLASRLLTSIGPTSTLSVLDGGYNSDDDAFAPSGEDEPTPGQTEWQRRMENKANTQQHERPRLVHQLIAHAAVAKELRQAEAAAITAAYQQRIHEAAAATSCSCINPPAQERREEQGASSSTAVDAGACTPTKEVRLQHLTWCSSIQVPYCSSCGPESLVRPLDVGCFDAGSLWVPLNVLEFFRYAHERGGFGATGTLERGAGQWPSVCALNACYHALRGSKLNL